MKKTYILLIVLGLALYAVPAQSLAQSKEPLEITADETLEWHRNEKTFIATKNALAKQGKVSIAAQTLEANYRETKVQNMEIWRVIATKSVKLKSGATTASGDKIVYNIDKGLATMTGKDLRMTSPDQIVTAEERFEYGVTDGRLIAIGNAKVERLVEQDTLHADKISAVLKENAKGQRVLHSLEAIGNVIIKTPTEIITGAYGIYNTNTNKAEISGGVRIRRGLNVIEGEKAEVDLTTNTSRMFGSKTGKDGRVRGVFYPGSEKALGNTGKTE